MSSGNDIKIIIGNLKELFIIASILMLFMGALCFPLGTPEDSLPFIYGFILSLGIGVLIWIFFRDVGEPELRHAMIIAALAYLIVPAISAIPYLMVQGMTPLDAMFEGISGWTGSGFSMIPHPENADKSIQLWRSITQWMGGIGVIVLMVTILMRPGTSTYIFYQSEARRERIHPSIRSTIRTIWGLYVVLTVLGVFLLIIAGMPLWDSLNHAMVGIGTGGFSIYSNSIAAYDSVWIEMAILPIMITGALPFVVIYKAFRDGKTELVRDDQVRAFLVAIVIGAIIVSIELFLVYNDAYEAVRVAIFQFVSAITCTGFQTTDFNNWTPTAMLILSIAMIIGGCAGSTAGGIKVARAIFITNEVKLWFKRTLLSKNAIVTIRMGNKRVTEDALAQELSEATLISFLWIVSILISVMALSHVLGPDYDVMKIIFEVCSAQGNVGLSCGIANVDLSWPGKIVLMLNMWIGRLEIIPITLLLRTLVKGFRV